MTRTIVLAAAAHPDDIEFMMAGTLLLLRQQEAEIHVWNLANGSCGTMRHGKDEIVALRRGEAQGSAKLAGATWHPPMFDDLAIFYDRPSLARVAAVVRQIRPNVVLTHSPVDYMEDHENTCRLIVTAAFARGMVNFPTEPPSEPFDAPVAIYHALPHGLRNGLGGEVRAGCFVDVGSVLPQKRAMLAEHRSQQQWLDASQRMNAYLDEMQTLTCDVGRMSGAFEFAEGWRRHSHLGFAGVDYNPMADLLGSRYLEKQP